MMSSRAQRGISLLELRTARSLAALVMTGYHFKLSSTIGSVRMRLPVAAKMALHKAGAAAGNAGSPNPVGGAVDFTKCTSTTGGESFIRIRG